jgi:hypothetical protein
MTPYPSYPCVARLYAKARDAAAVGLLPLPMPFLPAAGMHVAGIDAEHESFEIERVTWDPASHTIRLELESVSDDAIGLAELKAELNPGFIWSDEEKGAGP